MSDCCEKGCACSPKKIVSITKVNTFISFSDRIGGCKARWGIGRMKYEVQPGVYALGSTDVTSPVLVTANYKLTFDTLRKELVGVNAWILVLDTKGINVWCAAGKGTFGTQELLNRIALTNLEGIVSHRTLILPQLGAPGVSAHEITKQSGFRVVYGPVSAKDVKAFLDAGMKSTAEMRRVKFNAYDRLVLTPMEIVGALKPVIIVVLVGFFLNYFGIAKLGLIDLCAFLGSVFAGAVLAPVLLPWVPGKAFSFKGWFVGLIWALIVVGQGAGLTGISGTFAVLRGIEYFLVLPAVSAFLTMNFTGSSTYTSFSGVLKEMKIALPFILSAVVAGIVLLIVDSIIF